VRRAARAELAVELANPPIYFGRVLTAAGRDSFHGLLDAALASGTEETLELALNDQAFWNPTEEWYRNGVRQRPRQVNVAASAKRLAITEFNTWYVRGLCRVLLDEGVEVCQVYRAAAAFEPRGECLQHDGQTYSVLDIYNGHRARYWPEPGRPDALAVPVGVNCHHTIRRPGPH
jgi:hypothetical protein